MTEGFGLKSNGVEEEYSEYLGKYVEIRPLMGHETFLGKMIRLEKGIAVLNPHYSKGYTPDGAKYSLSEDNQKIDIIVPFAIRPTTREDLENLCVLANENSLAEMKKARESRDQTKS